MQSDKLEKTIELSLDVGYRLIDTAFMYRNEKQIGTALNNKLKEGKIKREDIFIVSKVKYLRGMKYV